ncbi:YqaE/Pmp3 family membrane protein [Halocola ammonii]
MNLIEIILVILLPPVPVALRFGVSGKLLISIILTLLGWIPGVIYSIWVLTKKN